VLTSLVWQHLDEFNRHAPATWPGDDRQMQRVVSVVRRGGYKRSGEQRQLSAGSLEGERF
jgi:hypothetical protein